MVESSEDRSGSPAEDSAARAPHFVHGPRGTRARMVDVGAKEATPRVALARAQVVLPAGLWERAASGGNPKGPVEEVARIAGVLAAKRTDTLIPLCHGLPLEHVDVWFHLAPGRGIDVYCEARCRAVTGVEMEALVGASIAALTVYDMLKGLDHGIRIEAVELLEKRGGRSGTWRAAGWDEIPDARANLG